MAKQKAGRKQKHHIDSLTGLPVVGLTRRPDGRWRVIGTHQTFREPDEQKAIAHFRELMGERKYGNLPKSEIEWLETPAADIVDGNAVTAIIRGFALVGNDQKESWRRFWAYVAQEINDRPKWVAKQTGIEQIGYLTKLKAPVKLPTAAELQSIWEDHAKVKNDERRKVLAAWKDFTATAKVVDVGDITAEVVIQYRDTVYARGSSGKTQMNLFNRVRRMLTFAKSRAIAPDELTTALNHLSLLTPSETTVSLDPMPISVKDFKSLLDASQGDDRAMVLLMLNAALYLQEAIALRWSEIENGSLVTHRQKKGKIVRVAVLWQETLDALAKVKRRGEYIFVSGQGTPLTVSGAGKRFRKLRTAAKLGDDVTAAQLRDGAYTAAVEANVTEDLCKMLVGHRRGISDHYVKRKPSMVAPACEAIHKHYFE